MPHAITENHANADFGTGLALPDNGADSFQDGVDIWNAAHQQEADRLQKLWKLLGSTATPSIHIPMVPLTSGLSNFTVTTATNRTIVSQSSVSSAGAAYFPLPPLVVGLKITAVTAYWQNTGTTTLPTGQMPVVRLYRQSVTVGGDWSTTASVLVGSQADTTAVLATYKLNHLIALTGLSETIDEDKEFLIKFEGEAAGANSVIGGNLMALRVTLGI